jgi:hypothetical protein
VEAHQTLIDVYIKQLSDLAAAKNSDLVQWQARKVAWNFALLVIPAIYLRRVMRMHALDPTEVAVFHFWALRAQKEYVQVVCDKSEMESLCKIDKSLLRGAYYGKDHDEFWNIRAKL